MGEKQVLVNDIVSQTMNLSLSILEFVCRVVLVQFQFYSKPTDFMYYYWFICYWANTNCE